MTKVVRKLFFSWNVDEEEKWLNEMSAKGLDLVTAGLWKYTFEDGNAGEYNYRIELLKNSPLSRKTESYLDFVEGTGAECIGTWFGWAYFRKKAALGEFELFSDIDSRIKHLDRILLLLAIFSLWLPHGLYRLYEYVFSNNEFSLITGTVFSLVGGIMLYGFVCGLMKRRKLKADRSLHE